MAKLESMAMNAMVGTTRALMAAGKGLLAMDESLETCNRRFGDLGIAQTEECRRSYRDLLVTTPGLSQSVSGAILFHETLYQSTREGTPFVEVLQAAGIQVGIKVDAGTQPLAGHPQERVCEGLDGLRQRLQSYAALGVRFAKWRATLGIGEGLPSRTCIEVNAHALARYAALCQEAGIVPIVEPEVLADGAHPLEHCRQVTTEVLNQVFEQTHRQGVILEAMILKPNMVLPGRSWAGQVSLDEVADATIGCLLRAVPAAVAGVAFLSGGQSGPLATARLNAMHLPAPRRLSAPDARLPWPLTFSYGRALQQPAMTIWAGDDANRVAAQQALLHRARCNSAAVLGQYEPMMDIPGVSP